MSDLKKYIKKKKATNKAFANYYDAKYLAFKTRAMLKQSQDKPLLHKMN